ncbi:hypothetical protein COCON_G00103770 [Conger conger]|uniref:Uncharacterized protein n=1 Tax=Conger conger TaxID=82655 RepID=A0A9Q1DIP2_CONCO|nr:hypothetical protein COCON_G00103770 [Conger conger]
MSVSREVILTALVPPTPASSGIWDDATFAPPSANSLFAFISFLSSFRTFFTSLSVRGRFTSLSCFGSELQNCVERFRTLHKHYI